MFYSLLEWALRVVVAAFALLLLSLLLWFVFDALMRLFHGPELDYSSITLLVFLAAIAVGSWGVSFLARHEAATTP